MLAIEVFDVCQTIFISISLVITIPIAFFVYFKLLFVPPFAENFTFKLIVVNGITEIINCVSYLFQSQLTSFPFMYPFFKFLERNSLTKPLLIVNVIFGCLSLHSSLFIALNRLKAIMFLQVKGNDSVFFIFSIIISCLLSIPKIIDFSFFTTVYYIDFYFDGMPVVFPKTSTTNRTVQVIATIVAIVISLATLIVNIILVVILSKERQFFEDLEKRRFTAERGLIVTSVVSYIFYMLFFINNALARYLGVFFCGYAQFLFLGLSAITPFWCLLIFTPSIRRMAFNRKEEVTVSIVQHRSIA